MAEDGGGTNKSWSHGVVVVVKFLNGGFKLLRWGSDCEAGNNLQYCHKLRTKLAT